MSEWFDCLPIALVRWNLNLCAEAAPFDAILVSAAGPDVPAALKDQLTPGGHLVLPVGPPGGQTLLRLTRSGPERFASTDLGPVSFVPLVRGEVATERG
uniref:protein-L-isoaspartate O-methyltransferase family protein n=1 Tax=Methylobacterium radiotolerans TaxID=31998 RepID=UPI002F35AF51